MAFGVTETGFVIKTYQDILDEIVASEKAAFGPNINTLPTSAFGQINGVFADAIAELWELANAVYASQFPDTAFGQSLSDAVALTGVTRLTPTFTTANLDVTIKAGETVTTGTNFSTVLTNDVFISTQDVTNSSGIDDVFTVPVQATASGPIAALSGSIQNLDTTIDAITETAAILTTGVVGPFVFAGPEDFTITIDSNSPQIYSIPASSYTAAQLIALLEVEFPNLVFTDDAGKIQIESTVDSGFSLLLVDDSGANSVLQFPTSPTYGTPSNPEDANVGTDEETDAALRTRQQELLQITGSGTLAAIRADVLRVSKVLEALVFENDTDLLDTDRWLPPHSVQIIIYDLDTDLADDTEVAQAILDTKPAGLAQTVVVTDSVETKDIGPFDLGSSATSFLIRVDWDPTQLIDITLTGVQSAANIATHIDPKITGATATDAANRVIITSDSSPDGAIFFLGGDALEKLSFQNDYSVTLNDDSGSPHLISFQRTEPFDITIDFTEVFVKRDYYAGLSDAEIIAAAEEAITEAILAEAAELAIGEDVYPNRFLSSCFVVQSVIDVTGFLVNGGSATIPIAISQRAAFDSSRINIAGKVTLQ